MEQVGFIGAFDKKDLILNIARILTISGKKVLVVDATTMQRLRYVVPRISNAQRNTYISEYIEIDVALGFLNFNGIMQYLGHGLDYDIAIIDTDNIQTVNSFMLPNLSKNFFVTSYDEFELQRGLEIFRFLQKPMEIYKVIYSANITGKEDAYLDHLIEGSNVRWKKEKTIFADTIDDRKATLENQLVKDIIFKNYTGTYKDSLEYLILLMASGYITQPDIRKIMKKM